MQYIYAGAPAFSVPPLQQMLAAGFCVCAVLTRPDRSVGRRARLTPTPLKAFAQEAGIPVLDYERVRDHAADLAALGADALVTCAYGQILTQEVLDAFPRGVYNIHASLLPRWRGASPIQHAVWAGDAETGITVMRTDVGLDTGDVLLRRALPLDGTETAGGLAASLSALGGACICEALAALEGGRASFAPQGEAGVTLCKKIKKEDAAVDFSRPAEELSRLVRAMAPEPLAWSSLRGTAVNFGYALPADGADGGACGQVVRADKSGVYIRTGEGLLRVTELQFAGGKMLRAADAVNGRKVAAGDVFGEKE